MAQRHVRYRVSRESQAIRSHGVVANLPESASSYHSAGRSGARPTHHAIERPLWCRVALRSPVAQTAGRAKTTLLPGRLPLREAGPAAAPDHVM
jgi:hypothetical protein